MTSAYQPPPRGPIERLLWWSWRRLPDREQYVRKQRRRGQTCFVWCPSCGSDLAGHPDTSVDDGILVDYLCGHCGHGSTWDFDSYPVPVHVPPDPAENDPSRMETSSTADKAPLTADMGSSARGES